MPSAANDLEVKRPGIWPILAWTTALSVALLAGVLTPPGTLPYAPASQYSDAAISHWPNALFLREAVWTQGQWPLWNPTHMLGQPFAANPLSKVWYPPQWLVLILPPTLSLNVLLYAHMAFLSLGMVAWARGRALHPLAAMFAAFAWALNPKLVAHLGAGHLDVLYGIAWTPWLLWSVDRLHQRTTLARGLFLGTTGALLVLADLRIAFYMYPVAILYAVVRRAHTLLGGLSVRSTGPWLAAGLVILLLTTVQTLPLIALTPYLSRSLITPQEASIYSLPANYLLGMVFANTGGFHEWMTYIGLPVIGLAAAAILRPERREMALWWIVVGIAVLWSLGENGPLFYPVLQAIPVAAWFRVPSRAWFVAALALILLSAYGLDYFLRNGPRTSGRMVALSAGFGGIVWAAAAVMMNLPANVAGAGTAIAATGVGMWLASRSIQKTVLGLTAYKFGLLGGVLLVATQVVSTLVLDRTLIEGRQVHDEDEARLAAAVAGECQLVYSPSFDLLGPAAADAHIPTLHGVDPFQLQWSAQAIARAAGVELTGYSITAPPLPVDAERPQGQLIKVEPDYAALRELGTAYIVTRTLLESDEVVEVSSRNGIYIFRLVEPGRYRCGAGPNRMRVPLDSLPSGAASVVVNRAWAPGWLAWIDGEAARVSRTEDGLMVVSLPARDSTEIELVYRPLADLAGMSVSGATVLVLVGGWLARRGGRRGDA